MKCTVSAAINFIALQQQNKISHEATHNDTAYEFICVTTVSQDIFQAGKLREGAKN